MSRRRRGRRNLSQPAGNKLGHFLDVFGGAHQNGLSNVEIGRVFEEGFFVFGGVVLYAEAFLGGFADDFVVHVGNVHDVADLIAALQQKAMQDVHGDNGAKVADVHVVINRGTAGIHADFVGLSGSERLELSGERIVETKSHRRGVDGTAYSRGGRRSRSNGARG